MPPPIAFSPAVAAAMAKGDAVVALESTIVTHGMPYPQNVETAVAVEDMVRKHGAVPATIALLDDGQIHVGLTRAELTKLAKAGMSAHKTSRRDIPYVLSKRLFGATTVAATSLIASWCGIEVFVTGGIGGVHRGAAETFDVSADLIELSKTPVMVVCAGAKSILDLKLTLEVLETQGVAVMGYQCDEFPAFFTSRSGLAVPLRVDSPQECAAWLQARRDVRLQTGCVLAVPIAPKDDMQGQQIEEAVTRALKESEEQGIEGKHLTPFLLERINTLTQGASLQSNIALVLNNARVGALIAVANAQVKREQRTNAIGTGLRTRQTCQPNPGRGFVVMGGMAVDILARKRPGETSTTTTTTTSTAAQGATKSLLLAGESNVGDVELMGGGVARNIAVALPQERTRLVSVVANDQLGHMLLRDCERRGMSTASIGVLSDKRTNKTKDAKCVHKTACYAAMLHGDGEMAAAVASMDIFQHLTPRLVDELVSDGTLARTQMCIVDANTPSVTIHHLLARCKGYHSSSTTTLPSSSAPSSSSVLTWFEPTSAAKCRKILGALPFVDFMSPNENELAMLTGVQPQAVNHADQTGATTMPVFANVEQVRDAACALLKLGVGTVVVKRGWRGVFLISRVDPALKHGVVLAAPKPRRVVDVTGAGDALVAGMAVSLVRDQLSIEEACKVGMLAARAVLEGDSLARAKL